MSLHGGLDTVSIATGGCWTKTYGASEPGSIANLYASRGFIEDAVNTTVAIISIIMHHLRQQEAA